MSLDQNPTSATDDTPPRFRRSATNRMLGGVAGGIARRFGMDANIVRAVFIALTFVWGGGVALYLALWAVVPADEPATGTTEGQGWQVTTEWTPWHSAILFVGALCAGVAAWVFVLGGPRFGSGISVIWLVLLMVIALLSLRHPGRLISLRRVVSASLLTIVSLFVLACGGFLAFVAATGVPIAGGVGVKVYQPSSVGAVHSTYRTAFGKMTVDLRQVLFAHRTVEVTATVAVGDLVVEVPPGVIVDLSTASGTPHISYPQGYDSFSIAPKRGVTSPHLVLNTKVGVGQIELIRAAPGAIVYNV